jgi:cytidylate kinase
MQDQFEEEMMNNFYDDSRQLLIIFISGAHGSGKSSIGKALFEYFDAQGIHVYHLTEMPFLPTHKTPPSPEFQQLYHRFMRDRDGAIHGIINYGKCNVLICDRISLDVNIYDKNDKWNEADLQYLSHELMYRLSTYTDHNDRQFDPTNVYAYSFLIRRDAQKVMKQLTERMLQKAHNARQDYEETNTLRWARLDQLFYHVWNKTSLMCEQRIANFNDNIDVEVIENKKTISDARDEILNYTRHVWGNMK